MSRLFRARISKEKPSFKIGSPFGRRAGFLCRLCLPAALVVAIAFANASRAFATTIIVNSIADPGAAGICTLRDAITAANGKAATNGCAAGTGTDTIKFSVTGTITFASELPAIAGKLTIIGPSTAPGITIDGNGHRVTVVSPGASLGLLFLTVANARSFSMSASGGAIHNDGNLTVTSSTFRNNRDASGLLPGAGGAIGNTGVVSVTNGTFSNNYAGAGGAINSVGAMTITNSTFSDNQASRGGAISSSGTVTVNNSTFARNVTKGPCSLGSCSGGQGGAIQSSGAATITNSTFSANSTLEAKFGHPAGHGGAIYVSGTAAIITNSTFSGNVSADGGAVAGPSRINGSILAASTGSGNCSTPHPIDAGGNISDDTSCGFSGTGAMGQKLGDGVNPLLDPKGLQNNGGPTQTIALQPTSPAIDAIPFASCTDQATPPHQLKNDQRGKPRPDPADGSTGPCDVGAYEFPTPGPIITAIPKVILTGDQFNITGQNFTAGSVVNLFIAYSTGVENHGPVTPSARSATQLTVAVPIVGLGNGFVSVQVVNADEGYLASNSAPALLQAEPSKTPFPTITSINGHPLADTSSDPRYAINNVETLVVPGTVITLGGMGFGGGTLKSSVDLFCACPGGKVGPFPVTPTSSTSISFALPATGPDAPVTGPGSFVVTDTAPAGLMFKSNAVSAPIGDLVSVNSVAQSVSPPTLITVNGTGFSTLTVINFFNKQGAVVKNLGGLKPDGSKAIDFTLVNDKQLTFTVPKGAVAGESYVQALNPPFVPYTSSDNDPGGAFPLH